MGCLVSLARVLVGVLFNGTYETLGDVPHSSASSSRVLPTGSRIGDDLMDYWQL